MIFKTNHYIYTIQFHQLFINYFNIYHLII